MNWYLWDVKVNGNIWKSLIRSLNRIYKVKKMSYQLCNLAEWRKNWTQISWNSYRSMKCSYDRIIHEVYESLWSKNFLFAKLYFVLLYGQIETFGKKYGYLGCTRSNFRLGCSHNYVSWRVRQKMLSNLRQLRIRCCMCTTVQCLRLVFQKNIKASDFKTCTF